ncbi:MAG: GFA family protein [Pseudomonadota bacterium]
MLRDAVETDGFTGGCACGAVAYRVDAGPVRSLICHCDDCRRATGSTFATFLAVPRDTVRWDGAPRMRRSSDWAQRGFCADCGTPLVYMQDGADTVEITAGTTDLTLAPVAAYFAAARAPWTDSLAAIPHRPFHQPSGGVA